MHQPTSDRLLGGNLKIRQSASGYRFSMDAVILARLAEIRSRDRVLDLGSGCGVIPLILASREPDIQVFGVDIQKSQVDIAIQNVRENRLDDRITIYHEDIISLNVDRFSGPMDAVVCNPPHIEKGCGRINPDHPIAISRHEIRITLAEIISATRRLLNPSGRFWIIYPAKRLVELLERMRQNDIEPKTMTIIYTRTGDCAKRVLIEGVKGGRPGIAISEPLIIHGPDGAYTDAARRIFMMEK